MKRKQVNAIFIDEARRKRRTFIYSFVIVLILILSILSLFVYFDSNKDLYVKYDENSDLKYQVELKDNEFFDKNVLPEDKQYISTLIKNINTNFIYKLNVLEKDIDYKYSYRVEADVRVKEKDEERDLYQYKEDLVKVENKNYSSNTPLEIIQPIVIDYNKYNSLINKFITTYELEDTISTLNVRMYVTVNGNCDDESKSKESVMTLEIPLTTKTVGIDMTYDLIKDKDDNVLICKSHNKMTFTYLVIAIVGFLVDIYLIYKLVTYLRNTRTAQSIYETELKRILNNYKSYIQKVNNDFDLKGYQVLKIDTFTDMLEIRDTILSPILMVENKRKSGVFFIIPSNTKILYCYSLKVGKEEAVHEK